MDSGVHDPAPAPPHQRVWYPRQWFPRVVPSTADRSPFGCIRGRCSFATIATNPMDVLKTRVMTRRAQGAAEGWLSAAVQVQASEGAGAFLKGALPRLLHKIPASAMFWLLYETFRALLKVEAPPKRAKAAKVVA